MDISLLYTAESIAAFFGFGFGCLVLNEATDAEVLTSRLLAIRDETLAAAEAGDDARVAALAAEFDSLDAQLRVLERQNRVAELEQSPGARTQPGPRATATAAPAQRSNSRPVQAGAGAGAGAGSWKQEFARAMVSNADRIKESPGGFVFSMPQAAITTAEVGTTVNAGLRGPGVVFGAHLALGSTPVGGSVVEYSRHTGASGAVAQQSSEGSSKAAFTPTWSIVTAAVKTFAGLTKVSEQALADQSMLQSAVVTQLARSHAATLDDYYAQVLQNFASSFSTSSGLTVLADLILECITEMRLDGFNPSAIVMSQSAWVTLSTAKASGSGEYLAGGTGLDTNLGTLHGLRVVLSNALGADSPTNRALVIDGTQAVRGVRMGIDVRTQHSADDFEKNLLTTRLESREVEMFFSTGCVRKIA